MKVSVGNWLWCEGHWVSCRRIQTHLSDRWGWRRHLTIDEYLDGIFKDAFRRELEVDENVARTLPFFAATLALAATLYGYALSRLPPPAWTASALALHVLLILGVACLIGVLWNLFQAVRMREYRIPPRETELAAWVGELRAFYEREGGSQEVAEARESNPRCLDR